MSLSDCLERIGNSYKELVNLHGVTLDPLTPARIERPIDLVRIYMQDYKPQDSESPYHLIDQLHFLFESLFRSQQKSMLHHPSGSNQRLDKQVVGYNPYKCHLKDKAKFKFFQSNENNIVAASWQLHHLKDGLNSTDAIPGVALLSVGSERIAEDDNRIMPTQVAAWQTCFRATACHREWTT